MTADRPGRGRPTVFSLEQRAAYLELVASGVRQGPAATRVGVDRRRVTYLAAHNPEFATALAAAKARGRDARIPHGTAGGYDNYDCRCGPCTKAASGARAGRRDRNAGGTGGPGGEVIELPAASPPSSFPLASAS